MTNEEVAVAPSLSTHQGEDAFTFQRYDHSSNNRKHLSLQPVENGPELDQLIYNYYSIEETIEFIKSKPQCKRVTLQFPDELVCDCSAVAQAISSKLDIEIMKTPSTCGGNSDCSCPNSIDIENDEKQTVWILADTSYSPCCVDEVAAEHVKGDVVIHYGDACLNPVSKVQVAYVFGKPAVNIDETVKEFQKKYEDSSSRVLLMADAPHSYIMHLVYEKLHPIYPNIAFADISQESFPHSTIIGYKPMSSTMDLQLLNRTFHHLVDDEDEELEQLLMSYDLFHISVPEAPRLLKLTTVFQSVTLFDPVEGTTSQGPFPNLMRRYRYMHMARSAGTIGLLVNTLSLSNTKLLLNKLKAKIIEADKKQYMFVVGKPNVAKLSNFEPIDIWCILGCDHQGIIIDQNNEYFKPIITPFELLLALNQELSWNGKWETDFGKLLVQLKQNENENEHEDHNSEDDEPQFNPVTGKFASSSTPLRRPQYLQVETSTTTNTENAQTNALVNRFSSEVVIRDTVSTAAAQLQTRHWTGLGSDYVDDEENAKGALVEDGIKGIARGYEFDVNNNS
ncbi:Diphthamide biosynthesis protein 2 [Yamadazyma tenuis]|uniref:2-(3-amino-3-carboxypropyl)histidine synthase subunit 2 n=1 Tax=Candida tenuis (strain ATCC 10573 / BCRC 21748 / CBS 615 / JCM 9827 / NBRC 10315 / NRRL Y-1498 / VKM Y-70) TaxID=590646 RepID=G3B799_CANTC|nr:diphthamide biosynthesis protein [Yamadazyma tenuis ATCC 10573]EGV61605.1 diphthamide biosynthesis protein [Yamadazyma tenuis ATCC 10573]WEJ92825.1 Diphthamide biosynthesis protein 2 [Yamadazyma tenuis]